MTHRKKFIIIAVLLFVIATFSALLARVEYSGICTNVDWECLDVVDMIAGAIFTLSIGIAPFLFVLAFLQKEVLTAWFKFARIYIPVALVLSIGGGSNGSDLFNTDAEFFTTFFSVIFVLASIILIVRAQRRVKQKPNQSSSPFPTGGQKSA